MRISILTYLEKEGDPKSMDVVVEQVGEALRGMGHEVSHLGLHGDLKRLLDGLAEQRPELVFNLLEDFDAGTPFAPVFVAGVLELLRIPFTGGGCGELYMRQDKSLAKKLLAFEKVAFPDFAVFAKDDSLETGGNLRMPLFVKPLNSDASVGIDAKALVNSTKALWEQVLTIQTKHDDSALVEEYIAGREFYVGVLGNREMTAFPPIEMDFSGIPEGEPRFMDSRAKWDKRSLRYKGTKAVIAQVPDDLKAKLQRVSMEAARALRVRDYGRIDLRLTQDNEIFVIEVNANCYLEKNSEYATAAKAGGLEYPALVAKIVDLALERQGKSALRKKAAKAAAKAEAAPPAESARPSE